MSVVSAIILFGNLQKNVPLFSSFQPRETEWPDGELARVGLCHSPLSIWRRYHAQPSPCWSEAKLPTPLCRILGIAAHRDAVMCHLALGPAGQELSLTSPLKLVCHWEPRQGESLRTTCVHSPRDEDRPEGDGRHLLVKLRLPLPLHRPVKPPGPKNCTVADQRLSIWSAANRPLCASAPHY